MEGDGDFIVCSEHRDNISIHSLRMEGDLHFLLLLHLAAHISIHSLRMEGDRSTAQEKQYTVKFQSTPSAWRETLVIIPFNARFTISIHSLRMEGDYHRLSTLPLQCYFNPLPPHGGRRWVQDEKAS